MEMFTNRFINYDLSPEDEVLGKTLSDANIMFIKNVICMYANDHTRIMYNSDQPHKAAIEQAYILGCIQSLEYLLAFHTDAVMPQLTS